jgi:hypothetical protein
MAQIIGIRGLFLGLVPFMRQFNLKAKEESKKLDISIGTYGIVVQYTDASGTLTGQGLVTKISDSVIEIAAFRALVQDSDGMAHYVDVPATQIDVSGYGNGTYKILFEYVSTYFEEGTIALQQGDATVVGTNTKFTEILAPNMYIVISNSGSGNNGKYQIDSITDDDHLELKTVFSGTSESGLNFAAGGHFPDPNVHPTTDNGYRIYENDTYNVLATTSSKGTAQYWLAQVVVASGEVGTITDKRSENILSFQEPKAVLDLYRIPSLPASKITSEQLALARGGTGVDLSASGGAHKFLAQDASHVVSARDLVADDIPNIPITKVDGTSIVLYDCHQEAAVAAGQTPPAFPEWIETDHVNQVLKIKGLFVYRTGMKYLKLLTKLKLVGGGGGVVAYVYFGIDSDYTGLLQSTDQSDYVIKAISLDLPNYTPSLSPNTVHEWRVELVVAGTPGTVYMTQPMVLIDNISEYY